MEAKEGGPSNPIKSRSERMEQSILSLVLLVREREADQKVLAEKNPNQGDFLLLLLYDFNHDLPGWSGYRGGQGSGPYRDWSRWLREILESHLVEAKFSS